MHFQIICVILLKVDNIHKKSIEFKAIASTFPLNMHTGMALADVVIDR